jgi:hypothetical protein
MWEFVGLLPTVVISGRAPKDLRRRVELHKVCYVGHHGSSCLEADEDVRWLVTPPRTTFAYPMGRARVRQSPAGKRGLETISSKAWSKVTAVSILL